MCRDRALFCNSNFNSNAFCSHVLGANQENPMPVKGIGNIHLPLFGGTVILKNVLFVPNIGRNLICVSRLLLDGYSLTFNPTSSHLPGCVLKLNSRVIAYKIICGF